ncbi:MAG: hypothetical protein R3245_05345, partial [Kiloniellales bacterium]|nr:hypothetical protein [Kiloniellales bacterium]
ISSLDGHIGDGAGFATTSLSVGVHTITASVTDSASQAGQDEVTVTVSNTPLPTTMAVADLDGMGAPAGRVLWQATVSIMVMDNLGGPVDGAVVSGAWSAGTNSFGTCTTGASGTCDISAGKLKKNVSSVTFSVTGIDGSLTYTPGDNGDPDGDSDGTNITILKP